MSLLRCAVLSGRGRIASRVLLQCPAACRVLKDLRLVVRHPKNSLVPRWLYQFEIPVLCLYILWFLWTCSYLVCEAVELGTFLNAYKWGATWCEDIDVSLFAL